MNEPLAGRWHRLRSYLFISSGLVCLVGFVFYLLFNNYRTASALQKALSARQQADARRYAQEVEHFLAGRQDDLAALAASEEIKGYFFSLEQGTSRQYGLAASRGPIEKQFASLVTRKSTDQKPLFSRLLLIDDQGETIAEAPRGARAVTNDVLRREWLAPQHRTAWVVFAEDGSFVQFSLACYYANKYVGQILAWADTDWLFSGANTNGALDQPVLLVDTGTDTMLSLLDRGTYPSETLAGVGPVIGEGAAPQRVRLELGGARQEWEAFRLPLQTRPLSVVTLFKASAPSSPIPYFAPMVSMSVIAIVIMGGAFLIFFLNTRSLLLKVRLEQSVLRQKEVEENNRRLETEIQERRRVESALSKSEQNYREIFNATSDAILLHDPETGRVLDVNRAALEMFGAERAKFVGSLPDVLGTGEAPFTGEKAIENIWRASLEGPQLFEWRCRRANGETFWTEVALRSSHIGGQGCVLAMVRDTTERKRSERDRQSLQEQLAQAQKIESIGRLAGGVAHDFNNLLTAILGNVDLMLCDIPRENTGLLDPLGEIQRASLRAADLTHQLLAFSRKQVLHVRPLDLNQSIVGFGRMLKRLIGEDIEVSTVLNPAIGLVKADPAQIEQVILNLAVNARDAMPRGGTLTIKTASVILDQSSAAALPEVPAGAYVMMEVSDTGCGMDAATQERVFEPFFTTKGVGQGTGLGLATIYGIVKQHNGHVAFESELGRGTTFRVYLPLHGEQENGASLTPAAAAPVCGHETVLVVEDDPAVRRLTCRMLSSQGYQVIEARDGADAIQLAQQATSIDLVFTDVIMPQMSGRQVAERISSLRPGIKVLYTSGYTDDQIAQQGIMSSNIHFLQKPFSTASLTAKLREVLDGPAPTSPSDRRV